jgi:hypothetical protein
MMARPAWLVDLGDRSQHLLALDVIEQIAKIVIPAGSAGGVEAVDRIGSRIGRLSNLTSP